MITVLLPGSLDIDETTRQSQGSDSGSISKFINEDSNMSFPGDLKGTEDSNDTNMSAGKLHTVLYK